VQRSKQPVAAPVSGEYATGTIATVRGRRKTYHQQVRSRITEARNRFPPVLLIREALDSFFRDPLTPLNQPRTHATGDDLILQRSKRPGGGAYLFAALHLGILLPVDANGFKCCRADVL
jgi:hypothetical protein